MQPVVMEIWNNFIKYSLTSIGLILCFSGHISAQEMVSPLDIPLQLSGNFGELRSERFHVGIDFRTQGVTGLPIKAVKEGFISRISVSPTGYGRVAYINHPDGTTTVYGHIDRFAPEIESAVRDSQYVRESFSVNLLFSAGTFPVRQGEVVAYSGNTGSSGGPHLHFELRETSTDKVIDALPAFKDRIRDTRPPEIRSLLFIPQAGEGIVNGSIEKQPIDVIRDRNGNYVLAKPVKAWGVFGIGIKAYDRMNDVSFIYGVKEIQLRVNNTLLFHSIIDDFFFNETRYLNSFVDWEDWRTNRSFHMKSFIEPGNRLRIYRTRMSGLLFIRESQTYNCEYILRDAYGNTSTFAFTITGEESTIPEDNREGILFPFDRDNTYSGKGMTLNIPRGNLYTDIYLNPDTIQTDHSVFAPLYSLGTRAPLHNSCPFTLTITNDSHPDKNKYGVVSVVNNRIGWMGGQYESGKLNIRIQETGQYTVAVDTVPPVVAPVNRAGWTASRRISFRITDNLSGIAFYQGRLDGQFALFEYDAKTSSLFCNFDAQRMKRGRQTLTLTVRDGAGNETHASYEVTW